MGNTGDNVLARTREFATVLPNNTIPLVKVKGVAS